jgi:hypothetical protein
MQLMCRKLQDSRTPNPDRYPPYTPRICDAVEALPDVVVTIRAAHPRSIYGVSPWLYPK